MIRTGHLKYKFVGNNKITSKYYYPIFKQDIIGELPYAYLDDTTEGWIWHTTSDLQNIFNTVYNNYRNLSGFSIKWLSTDGSDSNNGSYNNPVLTLDRVKSLTGNNPTLVLVKDTSNDYVYTYSSSSNLTKNFSNIVFFGGKFNSSLQCTSVVRPTIKLQATASISYTLNFKEIHNVKIIKYINYPNFPSMTINTNSTNEQYFNTIFQNAFMITGLVDTVNMQNPRWCYFHLAKTTDGPVSFNEYIYTGSKYATVTVYGNYYYSVYDFNGNLIYAGSNSNYYLLRDTIMNYLLSSEAVTKDMFIVSNLTTGDWRVVNAEIENRIILRRIGLINDFVNEYVITIKPNFYNDYPQFLNGYWLVDRNEDYSNFLNKIVANITADDLTSLNENFLLLVQNSLDSTSYDVALVFNQNVYNTVWSINDIIDSAWMWKIVGVFQVWQLSESVNFKKYADNSYEGVLVFRNYDNEIVDKSKPLIL
jgi:hypothetical protein